MKTILQYREEARELLAKDNKGTNITIGGEPVEAYFTFEVTITALMLQLSDIYNKEEL